MSASNTTVGSAGFGGVGWIVIVCRSGSSHAGRAVRRTVFSVCFLAQYPRGGHGILCRRHTFASPTLLIP